jgi:hypothetical protein
LVGIGLRDVVNAIGAKMFRKAEVALAAAFVLSTALSASAATKHHRLTPGGLALYDMVPGATCSPVHPPLCSNICTGSGPCAPPDSW